MLILAIDTSGRNGSVALCHGEAESFEALGLRTLEGGTYSARLVPCVSDLLKQANLSKSQIDGLVVVDGPGSFTGLRVGLSTAKALCEVLGKPLAAVSMLEAMAISYGQVGATVTAALDAGRGEVYVGEYEIHNDGARLIDQSIEKLDGLLVQLPAKPHIVTTFAKLAEGAAGSVVKLVSELKADAICEIGFRKLLAGETVDPATLDANYIRRSDAELFSLPQR